MKTIVSTLPEGGVSLCVPARECLAELSSGAWSDKPRGFVAEQIDRQIADGRNADAVNRFAKALVTGGVTEAEAYDLIRDRDCGHIGTGHELWSADDFPDDWFFAAWRRSHNGGPIWVDIEKARSIQFERIVARCEHINSLRKRDLYRFNDPLVLNLGAIRDQIVATDSEGILRRIWPEELGAQ